ncbi:MAG: MBL fold metallo-hydrolase [Acidimicrobiia bacterium]|nr:MBL fold metallo-hydrolase [Acidimicrobiia bacterium]
MTTGPSALVLGVAQDGGHPQPGCEGSCCLGEGTIPHLTTCVAVLDRGRAWLLDAGPDLPRHISRLAATDAALAGILLTHAHMGHYTGLIHLGPESMNTQRLPVWGAPRMVEFLRDNAPWDQLLRMENIELRVIDGPITLSDRVSVDAFLVPHRDESTETVGFRIEGDAASLLYVPDTDGWEGWDPPIEHHLSQVDTALLDGTFFSDDELPGRDMKAIAHPSVEESLRRFADLDEQERRKIHFTHLNHTNPLLRRDSDEFVRVARAGMSVANEGALFEL